MKILNLGSLNLDYVYAVDHFVQAGETIASLGLKQFCGGKGLNQSIALARAGADVYHAGKIGTDGEILKEKLEGEGIDTKNILVDADAATGHAVIQVDHGGQNCIIIYGGANRAVETKDIDAFLASFSRGDTVLVQNETSNVEYAIHKAHQLGMQVVLNPSPIDAALVSSQSLQYVDWFILNEIEGTALTGERDSEKICDRLRARYPNSEVVLTLGSEGVLYDGASGRRRHGIYEVPIVDTTAAGDTFTGYFIASVTQGLSVEKSLELASKASSLAVSRIGASDSIPQIETVQTTSIRLMG